MKKTITYLSTTMVLCLSVLLSCNDNGSVKPVVTDKVTQDFIESSVFNEFKENFPDEFEYINYSASKIEQLTPEVKSINLPVEKDGNTIGVVVGLTKPNGKGYEIIYQNLSHFNKTGKGLIELYTAKRNFIVDFDTEVKGTQVEYKIHHVRAYKKAKLLRSKSSSGRVGTSPPEWPDEDDSWWECTTKCYDYAKDVCQDDPECQFLCDITDTIGSQCTLSIAAACAIYCVDPS